jgi:hypothetical protein
MKILNLEEFQNRINEVAKSRKIFIESGLTKNISHAFQLYQEVLKDNEMEVFISGKEHPFNKLRPKCKCGLEMRLNPMPRKINGTVYPSTWICKCGLNEFTTKTAEQWYDILSEGGTFEHEFDNIVGDCPDCGSPLVIKTKCSGLAKGDYYTEILCTKCSYIDMTEKTAMELLENK